MRVEHTIRSEGRVRLEADGDPRVWHPPLFEVADFDRVAVHRNALTCVELVADTGWQPLDPSWGWSTQLAIELAPNERIVGVRAQQLRPRAFMIPLRTRWRTSQLEFVGRPAQLAPPDLSPLRQRAQLAGLAAAVVAVIGFGLTLQYRGRSPWLLEHGNGSGLALLSVLAGALASLLVFGLSLCERERWRWLGPAVGLGLVFAISVGLWHSARPSFDTARQAVERGDLDRAEFELQGLTALEGSSPETAALLERIAGERGVAADDARVQKLAAASSAAAAAAILREPWFDQDRRAAKLEGHIARARDATERAWKAGEADELRAVATSVQGLDEALAAETGALAQLVDVRAAIGTPDLSLAVERFAATKQQDAVAERRATVEDELLAALGQAARTQYDLGFEKSRSVSDRSHALDRFLVYEATYRELAGESLEHVDVDRAERQKQALAKEAAAAEARAQAADERRLAAERRRAEKASRAGSGSSSGGSPSAGTCCKYCNNSKPCGDSCISRSKTCHKGSGCAC